MITFVLGNVFAATGWGKWFPYSIVPLYVEILAVVEAGSPQHDGHRPSPEVMALCAGSRCLQESAGLSTLAVQSARL